MMLRNTCRLVLVLLLAALSQLGGAGAPVAEGAGPSGQVDAPLREIARDRPGDVVRVIVQSRREMDASAAVQRTLGVQRARLPQIGGIAAEVRADRLQSLASEPGVVRVALDPKMRLVTSGPDASSGPPSVFTQSIGAQNLWFQRDTGRGVAIAVLDSGIQTHEDFDTPTRIVHSERFNKGASSNADQLGHGTWVAGIAAGDGSASSGRYVGVAPNASIVNLKVSDDTGAAYASDIIQALGWVAANHSRFNIRVVNLSFVSSLAEGYATNLLDAAVEMVWHSGVVVVVSAGNQGANTEQYAPANDPYVLTVGATDDAATPTVQDDLLASFSSFGLTQDGFAKPDIVAPGRHIVGTLANTGAALAKQYPSKLVGTRYIQLSGTSASAPVVSGAVALLLHAHPELAPDQVKWLVQHSAQRVNGDPHGVGAGEIAIDQAKRLADVGRIDRANRGLIPNRLIGLAYLASTGSSAVNWDNVSWDSVSWDSVSWDSVSWDSVSWDSVSWDSVSWDSVIGND
jgi:serine protease AprX